MTEASITNQDNSIPANPNPTATQHLTEPHLTSRDTSPLTTELDEQGVEVKYAAITELLTQVQQRLINPTTGMIRKEIRNEQGAVVQQSAEMTTEAKRMLVDLPVDVVGVGVESVVIRFREYPQLVFKFLKENGRSSQSNPLETLELYHLHSLLSIIRPNHFPQAIGVRVGSGATVGRWEWIETAERGKFVEKKEEIQNSWRNIGDKICADIENSTGLRIRLDDNKSDNFTVDPKGEIKYLDNVQLDPEPAVINQEKCGEFLLKMSQELGSLTFRALRRHLLAYIELEVAKYAWMNKLSLGTTEFNAVRGELSEKSWIRVQKYFNYMSSDTFKQSAYTLTQRKVRNAESKTLLLTTNLSTFLQDI